METLKKTLLVPVDVVKRVESYQKENYLSSFTTAFVQLAIKGLEADKR